MRFKPFYTKQQIDNLVLSIAQNLDNSLEDNAIGLVVLDAAFIFAADIIRQLNCPLEMHFVKCTSREGTTQKDEVDIQSNIITGLPCKEHILHEKQVVIFDTIIDTGKTLTKLSCEIKKYNPDEIIVCALLQRSNITQAPYLKYCSDIIVGEVAPPDPFFVGYGLDYYNKYRDLPNIWDIQNLPTRN